MRAVILAAGIGDRLGQESPKVLLRFAGQSLLERHLLLLRAAGIDEVVVGVGFCADAIVDELVRLGRRDVRTVHNPAYRDGSVVTLWALGDAVAAGGDVILMDGDVLYDHRMLERLLASHHGNCFLLDWDVEPGEEPMKLALAGGAPVDFRKTLERPHDTYGESVGFFRFDEAIAREVVEAAGRLIEAGRRGEYMEEAIREVLLSSRKGTFGFEDVTGLPWIEIDFPEDVQRAEREIVPRLLPLDG